MRLRHLTLVFVVIVLFLVNIPQSSHAQSEIPLLPISSLQTDVCAKLVQDAFAQAGTNCGNLDRNSACYGFKKVTPAFTNLADNALISDPGDRAELTKIESLVTSAINTSISEYGITVVKPQANIHSSVDAASLVLIGDGQIESEVEPETEYVPAEPSFVSTSAETQVFKGFDFSETLGTLAVGENLFADAASLDGNYVRVLFEKQNGWVKVEDLGSPDISSLPKIGPDSRTPMQEYYLTTSALSQQCRLQTLPPLMVAQSPSEFEQVDMRVNEVDVRLEEATSVFRLPSSRVLEVYTLGGLTTLFPGTSNELIIPPGHKARLCLRAPEDLGVEGDKDDKGLDQRCGRPRLLRMTRADALALTPLGNLPTNITNHPISIPVIIIASGIGGVIQQIIFDDPTLLAIAQRLCQEGKIPAAVCRYLGLLP
ncbi:MAG: hypothetical protein HY862_04535 [Chloroflexi bacterium]|nr:hypothetical protein [Chloroflexota bacterium]